MIGLFNATNSRIDEVNESLNKRIDKVDENLSEKIEEKVFTTTISS